MDKVGAKITQLRQLNAMTVDDLARRVGHSPDEIRAIEAGERTLSHLDLTAMAEAFDIDVDDFFVDEGGDSSPIEGNSVLIPASDLAALLDKMKQG